MKKLVVVLIALGIILLALLISGIMLRTKVEIRLPQSHCL